MTSKRSAGFYRPELDVLRFVAFFSVYLNHTLGGSAPYLTRYSVVAASWITTVALAGKFGVDVFFVLSSYLITELLIRERDTYGTVNIKAFYIRRILRIWPLYFVFIFVALGIHWLMPEEEGVTWKHAMGFVFFVGNWLQVFHLVPVATATRPLWSVAVEEQFYLTWPLLIRRTTSRQIAMLAILLLLIANFARAIVSWNGVDGPAIWTNTFTRLDPIALGALLALGMRNRALTISCWWRTMLAASSVVSFILVSRFAHMAENTFASGPEPGSFAGTLIAYPIVAISAAVLVAVSILPERESAAIGRMKLLLFLGRISYGLYLIHELVLLLLRHAMGPFRKTVVGFPIYWSVALLLTVAAASISYQYIEKPFLLLKESFTFVKSRPA